LGFFPESEEKKDCLLFRRRCRCLSCFVANKSDHISHPSPFVSYSGFWFFEVGSLI
jgi:hypothetical protein